MNITVPLQKLATTFAISIPLKLADKIAYCLGSLFCTFSKRRRDYILRNLGYIFADEDVGRARVNRYLKNTFINYARCMVDFLRLGFISKEDFSVELVGLENIHDALRYGRGCIMLTMHIGNWDYAGSFLAARGVPMSALVEETVPEMYELYKKHREKMGMKTFPLSRAGYGFLHTIKNNRVLAVLGDRDILKTGVAVEFFGGRRKIPRGLGEIVIKKQMPVLFGHLVLNPCHKRQRYLGFIDKPRFFTGTEDEFNHVMVKRFEDFIRSYPDQWMLFESDWLE
jgi:lauroyl/myristoyl acyltransferase